jgi:hypothetical protein
VDSGPFEELLAAARADEDVLGLCLAGGRGKGVVGEESDWDACLVVADGLRERYERQFPGDRPELDIAVFTLDEFQDYGGIGSDTEGYAYGLAHTEALVDRLGGEFQALVDQKELLPPEVARTRAATRLDGYINSVVRSMKNLRDGRELEAHLDACESIGFMLETCFALGGRIRPYNKFLVWELERHALEPLPMAADELLAAIRVILESGDLETQLAVFRRIVGLARERGLGAIVDAWHFPAEI